MLAEGTLQGKHANANALSHDRNGIDDTKGSLLCKGEMFIFFPSSLHKSGLLYGCVWYRSGIRDLTVVVLDVVDGRSATQFTESERDAKLDWIGRLLDTFDSETPFESTSSVWIEFVKMRDACPVLARMRVQQSVDVSSAVKVVNLKAEDALCPGRAGVLL